MFRDVRLVKKMPMLFNVTLLHYCIHNSMSLDNILGRQWLLSQSRCSRRFMGSEHSLLCSQDPATGPYPEPKNSPKPGVLFRPDISLHDCFYGEELSAYDQPQSRRRLLIQYIRCYPPHLEAVPSIRSRRTRHAVVTRNPFNMDIELYTESDKSSTPIS
jgi:hypothetical protein